MIKEESLTVVGKLKKPHGYKGAIGVDMDFEKEIFADPKTPFFIKIDNIFVPFWVETIGGGSNGMSFIKIKDIDSDADAAQLAKKELYAQKSFVAQLLGIEESELETGIDDIIGLPVVDDETSELIGVVEGIMEGIEYDYLQVKRKEGNATIEIPLIDEFIEEIKEDPDGVREEIRVVLPDGFMDI